MAIPFDPTGAIVVGTDLSQRAGRAVEWASARAAETGHPLQVVLAIPEVPIPPRSHLFAAMQANDGQAHGVLTGDIAEAITKRFSASSPIYIDVSTEKRYAQPGCARLKVSFWQDGVTLPGAAAPRRQTVDFGINYCLDGRPPRSQSLHIRPTS